MNLVRLFIKTKQYVAFQLKKIRRNCRHFVKPLLFLCVFAFTLVIVLNSLRPGIYKLSDLKHHIRIETTDIGYNLPPNSFFNGDPHNVRAEKIDWHNYALIEADKARTGIGENGVAASLTDDEAVGYEALFNTNGYNALLSDKISVNRSVPDIRHIGCRNKKYLKELPTASIVIPFFNEHFSSLLRTAHSVFNRSPPELLKEIILVNDHSTKAFLWDQLDEYVRTHFDGKCKVIHLPDRMGLITARSEGARAATGDVLIFLDSHTEANVNWLPPLLDPIAEDYRTCVCPFIDVVDWKNYQYRAQDEGRRGGFDWKFFYKRFPLLPEDLSRPTEPFKNPVMAGGLFAISTKFFWELGGYDEGLDIWGGEQYELSFKIWQCGGQMLDAPCSRVGHVYRGSAPFPNPRAGKDFVTRNFKRVAEVWMDEYKEYIYMRHPEKFARTDAGDLTKQKAVRERLHCKSFKWFLEEVAPDIIEHYPLLEPQHFAYGVVQSVANPSLCVDTLNNGEHKPIGLYPCATNRTHPYHNQNFALSFYRDLKETNGDKCWDVAESKPGSQIVLFNCHQGQGNQLWRYDMDTQQMISGKGRHRCLDGNLEMRTVFVNPCDQKSMTQKWTMGYVNLNLMQKWETAGAKLLD